MRNVVEFPTVAFPVIDYRVPRYVMEIASRTGTLAAEITLTLANIGKAIKVVEELKKLSSNFDYFEVRFHLKPLPQYDFAVSYDGRNQALKKIIEVIDFLSERVGPGFLTVHSPGFDGFDIVTSEVIESLGVAVSEASKKGMVLCLENMASGWTSRPENLVEVAGKSGISIVLDIGHFNSSECCRMKQWQRREVIEALGVFTVGAHIYDHEEGGHIPASDHYLLWDALEALFLTRASWWVIEHTDKDSFFRTYSIIKEFLEYKRGGGEFKHGYSAG